MVGPCSEHNSSILNHGLVTEDPFQTKRVRSERDIKASLLEKCRKHNVDIPNFGLSWKSGLSFMAILMDYLQDDEKQLIAQITGADSPITVLDITFHMAERKLLTPRYE